MKTTLPGYKYLTLLLPALVAGFLAFPAKAQTYGNEWIVPSQTYYKIGTTKNGIHRLTYDWLTANIQGISGVNPQELKLYRRGQEQAIYVQGETDGTLNPGDYVEFYGQRNDGKQDEELYKNPLHHVNDYYSMFTDTAAYFLTWSGTPGKRMLASSPSTSGLTPEAFHIQQASPFQTREQGGASSIYNPIPWPHSYQRGRKYQNQDELQHSWGDESENFGFRSMTSSQGSSRTFFIDTLASVPTGADTVGLPKPVLRLIISGNSYDAHLANIRVGQPERTVAANVAIGDWELVQLEYTLNFKDITPATASAPARLRLKVLPQAGTGTIRLVLATLAYPQTFNLGGNERMIYPDPNEAVTLYRVTNAPANPIAYDLTDLTNIKRITGTDAGNGQTDFVFENTHSAGSETKMLVTSADQFLTPVMVRQAAMGGITGSDRDYLIISHKLLMGAVQGSQNPVQDYAQYRASLPGGSYKPVVADIEAVYDQFHYGEKSSYAIRNYIDYMKANSELKMVLLLGKALQLGYDNGSCNQGLPVRIVGACYEKDLVPTFGFPASDVVYVVNFKADDYRITVPIGRVSAQTPQQVLDYLNKVQGQESVPENLVWRKNILHLVGGNSPGEMQVLLALMNSYKQIAQGLNLGANVITIKKTSFIDPVQQVDVSQEVNNGVSLMSYFGHSSPTVTDLDIGFASDPSKGYNNVNKYPTFIMAGCATGNAFTGNNDPAPDSFGEDWILAKEKGAVNFLAHSTEGTIGDFDRYMRSFYKAGYQDSTYGNPMGQVHQQTVDNVISSFSGNMSHSMVALLMQVNLQGDPGMDLYGPEKPDYDVTMHPVTLTNPGGAPITADAAELLLTIPIRNLGRALPLSDSISISVKRILPNTTSADTTFKVPNIYYTDTVYYNFSGGGPDAYGLNTFEIWVDNVQEFSEISEMNNKITFEYFVPLSGVQAIFPYNFSIVPTQQVTLKGQAFDVLAQDKNYIFEIDTTHTFATARVSPVITADLLAEWTVDLFPSTPANDSVVYFWRVRFDIPGEDPLWSTSSFTYIPGSPTGWAQSHIGQFDSDGQNGIDQNNTTREWEFEEITVNLDIKTAGGAVPAPLGFLINNQDHFFEGSPSCWNGGNRILAVVLHPRTLREVTNVAPTSNLCGIEQFFYSFNLSSATGQDELTTFINSVPNNYYVAMMSIRTLQYSTFSAPLRAAFETLGATRITSSAVTLNDSTGYILVSKKGDPSFAVVENTANPADTVALNAQTVSSLVTLTGAKTPGILTSTLIGPAYEWGTLFHDIKQVQTSDSVQLKIIARTLAGADVTLYDDVNDDEFTLSGIDANQYPYLRLQLTVDDTLNVTPAQLQRWLVTYTPAPEGMIRPDILGWETYSMGTFEEGEQFSIDFKFQNISDVTFRDTVRAVFTLLSDGIVQGTIDTVAYKKIEPNEIVTMSYPVTTTGLGEFNTVRINVNPRLQPEQYYTNNFMEATFKVRKDNLHPVIDVVFDGQHIMDGDMVAPDPVITISLKDENQIMFKDDTVGMEVFLVREGGSPQRITLTNNPNITITPATANSDFRIVFDTKYLDLDNGMYTLMVQGADKTGNQAAAEPYKIRFLIINESTITHFYPYPNPFTNSCKFVFTLTGSEIPSQMKIQIITVTGKVVREITREELGDIRIGVNGNRATDFSWDGTDEYGDKLANGVYLYRVVIGNKGDNFKETTYDGAQFKAEREVASRAFKKDYGKLYILR